MSCLVFCLFLFFNLCQYDKWEIMSWIWFLCLLFLMSLNVFFFNDRKILHIFFYEFIYIHNFSEIKVLYTLRALYIYAMYSFSPLYSLILFWQYSCYFNQKYFVLLQNKHTYFIQMQNWNKKTGIVKLPRQHATDKACLWREDKNNKPSIFVTC